MFQSSKFKNTLLSLQRNLPVVYCVDCAWVFVVVVFRCFFLLKLVNTKHLAQCVCSDLLYLLILSYLSHSLADHCGTTVDFTTSFLHFWRFSAFCSIVFHSRPVRLYHVRLNTFVQLQAVILFKLKWPQIAES